MTIANPAAVCAPATVNITTPAVQTTNTGTTTTYWSDAAATIPIPAASGTPAALSVSGTYYIKTAFATGCSIIRPVVVTINPLPTLTIVNPPAVCSPSSVNITTASVQTVNTGTTTTYWNDAAGTVAIPAANGTPAAITVSGTYYIKSAMATGCFVISPVVVTINPKPNLVITNPAAVCSPATVDLTAASVTSGSTLLSGALSYWTDAAATIPYTTPATAGAGTYYIKVTTSLGCTDVEPVVVTVNSSPTITSQNACIGGGSITFLQTGGGPGGTWTVSGGGTIVAATGVFTPSTAGCFTVSYNTSAGCPGTTTFTVFPGAPTVTAPANTCNTAFNLPTVASVPGFTTQFSIDGGTYSNSPTIPTAVGCHQIRVRYILTANCGTTLAGTAGTGACAEATVSVVIFPPAPTITAPSNTCNAAFTLPSVTPVPGFSVRYSIDLGAFSASPSIPTTPGCHSIQAKYFLTAACAPSVPPGISLPNASPCGLSNTVNVVVFPPAPPAPTVNSGCGPIVVTAPSIPSGGFAVQYSFDDGATWGANTPPTADNCLGYKIKTRYVTSAACGSIAAGTASIITACKESPATTRSLDNTGPATTCPSAQSFCIVASNNYSIPLLVATDNCAGAITITYQVTGATTRSGSGNNASGLFNLGTSTITWTATDACGNVSTCTTVVTINPLPTVSINPLPNVCISATTVALSGTPSGGSFSGPGVTGNSFNPSVAGLGTHTIIYSYTDANGCTATDNTTISVNSLPAIVVTPVSALCNDDAAVTLNASPVGGTFSGNGVTGNSFDPTVAGSGTHTITYTYNDPSGTCPTATSSISITVSPAATANAGSTQTVCSGKTVSLAGTIGGSGTSATWSAPSGTFTNANSLTSSYTPSITSGTVTLTLTTNDPAGPCDAAISTVVITVNPPIIASETHTAIACNGGTSTVTISATGGTAPYTGTGNFTQSAGTVSYTVTDSKGCTAVIAVIVSEPAILNASETRTAIACNGGTSTVTISATGGTAPYTGVGNFTQSAGTVSYTVTDAKGCTDAVSVTITQPSVIAATETHTAIACNGGNSTVTIAATGGTAPYTGTGNFTQTAGTTSYTVTDSKGCTAVVSVTVTEPAAVVVTETHTAIACNGGTSTVTIGASGGTAPYTGTGTFTQSAGTVSYTVTDSKGCVSTVTATVIQPTILVASEIHTAIACNGGTSTVTISATGGTAPYTGTGNFTQSAGTVSYTVTDSKGCVSTVSATVIQPTILVASEIHTAIACNGGTSTVTISATGGTAPYTGTGNFTQSAGTVSYTVTDAKGCTATVSVTITQPSVIVATETHTAIACNGGSSSVTIAATGGTAPYTGTGNFTQAAGTTSYTVTDSKGCTAVVSVTVAEPAAVVATETHTAIACNGGTSLVTIAATGGTAPYTGTGTFTQSAGTVSYTVTDSKGCVSTVSATVIQPTILVAAETHTVIACNGGTSTVTISATGGTAPYTGTGNFTQSAGTVSYTVTDSKGCVSTVSATVIQPTILVASEIHTAIACNGGTATVTISATGGTAPYTGTGNFTQSAGTVSYTVTDAKGCTAAVSVTIIQPSVIVATETHTAISCNGNNSTVTIAATGGTAPYTGTGNFIQAAGTTSYTVTDSKGCTASRISNCY